ncbi:polysaccharide deacetylase family protein [Paenibacillus sp. NPDC058071]|uniref:polysaccharide deacetylase family protein n=1 Tax=Paenibacillus sp. NPDC058071 TaxID=3346326 RepID=UPI0036DF62B8
MGKHKGGVYKFRKVKMLLVAIAALMALTAITGCATRGPFGLSSLVSAESADGDGGAGDGRHPATDSGLDGQTNNPSGESTVSGPPPQSSGTPTPNEQAVNRPSPSPTPNTDPNSNGKPNTDPSTKPDTNVTVPPSPPSGHEKPPESVKGHKEKRIALTFDDGPDQRYTPAILDILKKKGVKATFFLVGQQVKKEPEVAKRIVDEGHAVGNHSMHHKKMSKLTDQEIADEISEADELIEKAIGEKPNMFRAPYGAVSDSLKKQLAEDGRTLVGWNIDTKDWAGTSPKAMREMIRKEADPGDIILMHSFGSKNIQHTVEALPGIIDDLKKMGYTFVTADELAA